MKGLMMTRRGSGENSSVINPTVLLARINEWKTSPVHWLTQGNFFFSAS
jgi:hypothetical protein